MWISKKIGLFLIISIGSSVVWPVEKKDNDTEVCAPLKHFQYTRKDPVSLVCDTAQDVFNFEVPQEGFALARATFSFSNTGVTQYPHYWNGQIIVGDGSITSGIGDDICPYKSATKSILAYGLLSAKGSKKIRVPVYQGSGRCRNGQVVLNNVTLDVWVEDSKPQCQGKDLKVASYYKQVGFNIPWYWQTYMVPLLNITLNNDVTGLAGRNRFRVLSSVEGTPTNTPALPALGCNTSLPTLVAQTAIDFSILSQVIEPIPVSGGMAHLVLSTDGGYPISSGTHQFQLLLGKNMTYPVSTGGCCGDAILAVMNAP